MYLCDMNESMVVIENGSISAEILLLGAELRVLRKKDGENVMWAADTDHWNRVSPNLFPIVGRLKGDKYSVDGQVYEMRQHGFARDQVFEVIEASADEVALRLVYGEVTLAMYPYQFEFVVRYRLEGATLWVEYQTKNLGDADMLYSVGGHPGFALRGDLGQHHLQFGLAGEWLDFSAERHCIEGGLYTGETSTVVVSQGLKLSDDLFETDAIVFREPVFDQVRLLSEVDGPMLDFYCWEWDAVGFWTKPGAPFFCIEPWWGWADEVGATGEFSEKAGLHKLSPGAEESLSYGIGLP